MIIVFCCFSFIISSNDFVNLTVRVEDEYTYFAADRPLLEGATIYLTSSFGGETLTLVTTNSSGVLNSTVQITMKSQHVILQANLIFSK